MYTLHSVVINPLGWTRKSADTDEVTAA